MNPNSILNLIIKSDNWYIAMCKAIRTTEYRSKMSEKMKSIPRNPNSLKNLDVYRAERHSPWNKGKTLEPLSQEHKMKISKSKTGSIPWNKGMPHTEEQKQKMRKAWSYDKHVTPEILKKRGMSISKRWEDPEYKARQIKRMTENPPNKGYFPTTETREASRNRLLGNKNRLGIKHTDDAKKIIREKRLHQVFPTKNSKPERMMQIALALNGIKFEKHKTIFGQPDIFIEPNICVFVDGDYWHRIPKALVRDVEVNHHLSRMGYVLIRLWASDIKKNTQGCAENVIKVIKERMENVSL